MSPYINSPGLSQLKLNVDGRIQLELVGTGERKDLCGYYRDRRVACEHHKTEGDGHTNRHIKHSCHRPTCPDCFKGSLADQARVSASRIKAGQRKLELAGYQTRLYEFIYAIPQDRWDQVYTEAGYQRELDQALRAAQDSGYVGLALVMHETRVDHERASYKEYDRLRAGEPNQVEWGPHFQGIGIRLEPWDQYSMKGGDVKRKYSTVIKNLLFRADARRRDGLHALEKKLYYELHHASVKVTKSGGHGHVIKYYGALSYNSLSCKVETDWEMEMCRCGGRCQEFFEDQLVDYYYKRIETRTHELKTRALHRVNIIIQKCKEQLDVSLKAGVNIA